MPQYPYSLGTYSPYVWWLASEVQLIRNVLSSEVPMATYCSGEIVAKATPNDPMGKPRVVPSHRPLPDCRRNVVPVVAAEFADCTIDSALSIHDKVVHEVPDWLATVDTCR